MNQTFAPAACRLCALAARTLGWSPDIFWNATPAELALILAPAPDDPRPPLNRAELERLMEHDHDR